MNWFNKVKTWFKGLFKKEEVILTPVVAEEVAPVKQETDFSKKAKEVLALGPSDLLENVSEAMEKKVCDHILTFKKQTWVRVSNKKFELQNEMMCTKCDSHQTLPIA